MADSIDPSDVMLNRLFLSQARSNKVLQSWLPASDFTDSVGENSEDDSEGVVEYGGIGSKRAHDDDDLVTEPLRKKRVADDKLMEQLLGKKAAQARKKSLEAQKSMSTLKPSPLKPSINAKDVQHDADSDDEEEGGRATAFTSRKALKREVKRDDSAIPPTLSDNIQNDSDEEAEHVRPSASSTIAATREQKAPKAQKKATSYLDELLAQNAGKKKNKRKKGNIERSE